MVGAEVRSGTASFYLSPCVGAGTPSAAFPVPEFIGVVGSGCLADCGAVSMAAAPSLSLHSLLAQNLSQTRPGLRKDFLNVFPWDPTSILSCVGHSNSLL